VANVGPGLNNLASNCTFVHSYDDWLAITKAQHLQTTRFETSRSNFAKSNGETSASAQGNSVLSMRSKFFSDKTGLPFDFVMASNRQQLRQYGI
jgi:hypothetical protein